jgi:glycosyltransferase involved in cell wall biosynthesis
MRVLFLNNYSILDTYKRATNDVDHFAHTWGYDYFVPRCEASVADLSTSVLSWQQKLRTYLFLGDLKQQAQVIGERQAVDVVVAANMSVIGGLCYLKRFLRLPPLVGILHSVRHYGGKLGAALLRHRFKAVDRIVCLAKKDVAYLREQLRFPLEQVSYIPWSANPNDYDRFTAESKVDGPPYVMAMGLSDRDHITLIRAFELAALNDWELRIYVGGGCVPLGSENPKIKIIQKWVKFKDSLPLYRGARFIVVPLIETERTLGLTSLLDAMGVGRPVIMTRNPGIDINIEKEKMGFWVQPGDYHGLAERMRVLAERPELARKMGANARRYLDERYSYKDYCRQLFRIVQSLRPDAASFHGRPRWKPETVA